MTPVNRYAIMEAEDVEKRILKDHDIDISFSDNSKEGYFEVQFVLRTDFEYRLKVIRDEFFEGDGSIHKFHGEKDLRPMYIMVSYKDFTPM